AHSPGGDEGELDRVLLPYFHEACTQVHQDSAENLIGRMPGTGERNPILVTAHKDELGMIIKRVEPDGALRVEALGGVPPWKYGEGPVDILAPGGVVQGVMSAGSLHTTEESPLIEQARRNPLDWPMVRVFTGYDAAELEELGIGPGTRLVVSRDRKGPILLRDHVAGFGLDDKVALALMVEAMRELADGPPPPQDIYFVATSTEEQMGCGGTVAASELPIDTMLALEIGPVAPEYGLELDSRPIIWYRDSTVTYTKSFCDDLAALANHLGTGVQKAVYGHAGSDASCARSSGQVGRVACLSFPAINTHGYEVAPIEGILNMYRVLLAYLRGERAE
ncbi:MAG TPA: M42 family peptidase, partial [Armatimonadota bacterium]|nr:M42 family peptidase [Armatimonadota bacterium]